jgi:hypothetical protein
MIHYTIPAVLFGILLARLFRILIDIAAGAIDIRRRRNAPKIINYNSAFKLSA